MTIKQLHFFDISNEQLLYSIGTPSMVSTSS